MTRKRHILSVALATTLILPAAGQEQQRALSGFTAIYGATNFHKNEFDEKIPNKSADGEIRLDYKGKKFTLYGDAVASKSTVPTEKTGFNYNIREGKESATVDYTDTEKSLTSHKYLFGGTLAPSVSDDISLKFTHNSTTETPFNGITTVNLLQGTLQGSAEQSQFIKKTWRIDGGWVHRFDKPGRVLNVDAWWERDRDDRKTIWAREELDFMNESFALAYTGEFNLAETYRITPKYYDNDFYFATKYSDRNFVGLTNLDVDFGVSVKFKNDIDYYERADLKGEEWIDTPGFKESFNYLAMTVDPTLHARYGIGAFTFEGRYTPEYYTDRLNNDDYSERFDAGRFSSISDLSVGWRPSPSHSLQLKASRSLTRPDYLQMCWFQRPGAYLNEIRAGNPDLNPAVASVLTLGYTFSYKRLSVGVEVSDTYDDGKIEQTFNTVQEHGITYRIYTWINSGTSNNVKGRLLFKWTGQRLTANTEASINYYRGVGKSGKVTENSNYDFKGTVNYDFGRGWKCGLDTHYQSKIIHSYNSTSEYVGLNLRASKAFKHFELFLEGRDLLDKDIETETYSEDEEEGRLESFNYNRRQIRFGLKFTL